MDTRDATGLRLAMSLMERERLRFSVLSETFYVLTTLQDQLRRELEAPGREAAR